MIDAVIVNQVNNYTGQLATYIHEYSKLSGKLALVLSKNLNMLPTSIANIGTSVVGSLIDARMFGSMLTKTVGGLTHFNMSLLPNVNVNIPVVGNVNLSVGDIINGSDSISSNSNPTSPSGVVSEETINDEGYEDDLTGQSTYQDQFLIPYEPTIWEEYVSDISDVIDQQLEDTNQIVSDITDSVVDVKQSITAKFTEAADTNLLDGSILMCEAMLDIIGGLSAAIKSAIFAAIASIQRFIGSIIQAGINAISKIVDGLIGWLMSFFDGEINLDFILGPIMAIVGAIIAIYNAIKSLINKISKLLGCLSQFGNISLGNLLPTFDLGSFGFGGSSSGSSFSFTPPLPGSSLSAVISSFTAAADAIESDPAYQMALFINDKVNANTEIIRQSFEIGIIPFNGDINGKNNICNVSYIETPIDYYNLLDPPTFSYAVIPNSTATIDCQTNDCIMNLDDYIHKIYRGAYDKTDTYYPNIEYWPVTFYYNCPNINLNESYLISTKIGFLEIGFIITQISWLFTNSITQNAITDFISRLDNLSDDDISNIVVNYKSIVEYISSNFKYYNEEQPLIATMLVLAYDLNYSEYGYNFYNITDLLAGITQYAFKIDSFKVTIDNVKMIRNKITSSLKKQAYLLSVDSFGILPDLDKVILDYINGASYDPNDKLIFFNQSGLNALKSEVN